MMRKVKSFIVYLQVFLNGFECLHVHPPQLQSERETERKEQKKREEGEKREMHVSIPAEEESRRKDKYWRV